VVIATHDRTSTPTTTTPTPIDTGHLKESTMVPHEIYQALTAQHGHELEAAARRHERMNEARFADPDWKESSRLGDIASHLMGIFRVRRGSRSRAATTASSAARSTTAQSAAGPMGCVA
jgi:hypothetical protein